jgi:hypothetical protein
MCNSYIHTGVLSRTHTDTHSHTLTHLPCAPQDHAGDVLAVFAHGEGTVHPGKPGRDVAQHLGYFCREHLVRLRDLTVGLGHLRV